MACPEISVRGLVYSENKEKMVYKYYDIVYTINIQEILNHIIRFEQYRRVTRFLEEDRDSNSAIRYGFGRVEDLGSNGK